MAKNKFKKIVDAKRVIAIPLKKKSDDAPQQYRFKRMKPVGSRGV